MSTTPTSPTAPTAKIKLPDALPVAVGANYFHFAFAGPEMHLLVGTVDLIEVDNIQKAKTGDLHVQISHRFLLSPLGVRQLRDALDGILPSYGPQAGIPAAEK